MLNEMLGLDKIAASITTAGKRFESLPFLIENFGIDSFFMLPPS